MAEKVADDDWEPEPESEWKPPTEAEMKVLQAKRERADKISKLMGDYLLKGYKMLGTSCPKCMTILLRSKQGVDYCVACSELDSDAVKDDPALSREAARKQAAEQEQRDSPVSPEPDSTSHLGGLLGATSRTAAAYGGTEGIRVEEADDHCFHSVSDLPATEMKPSVRTSTTTSPGISTFPRTHNRNPVVVTLNSDGTFGTGQSLHRDTNGPSTYIQYNTTTASGRSRHVEHTIQVVRDKMQWATAELDGNRSVEFSTQMCQLIKTCAETLASLNLLQTSSAQQHSDNVQTRQNLFDTTEE